MLKMSSSNVSGASRIEDKDVVYFNASFSNGATGFVITKNIADKDLYQVNKIQCDTDYNEFEEQVMQYVGE